MEKIKIKIDRMNCSNCEKHIVEELMNNVAKNNNINIKDNIEVFNIESKINKDIIIKTIKLSRYNSGRVIISKFKKNISEIIEIR